MARVLIIDPVDEAAQSLARTVRALGYAADLADDGRAALASATVRTYDWVFFIERLPDMDGLDCFQKIRRRGDGTRGVMMAEATDVRTVFEAVRYGVGSVIARPAAAEEVARVLAEGPDDGQHEPAAPGSSLTRRLTESRVFELTTSQLRTVISELAPRAEAEALTDAPPSTLTRLAAFLVRRRTAAA